MERDAPLSSVPAKNVKFTLTMFSLASATSLFLSSLAICG